MPHASGQDVIGAGRCYSQPRRNQHTALQDTFAVQFDQQQGGGTGSSKEDMEERARFLLPRRSMPSSVLGRPMAAQVAAVLGTLNQIIRTQRT